MNAPETVTCPAILIAGRIIEADTHLDAWWEAVGLGLAPRHETGDEASETMMEWADTGRTQEGFTTSAGRFVSRYEAFQVARASGQVKVKTREPVALCGEDLTPLAPAWQ